MHCPNCGEPLPGQVMWSVDLAQAAAAAPFTVRLYDATGAAPVVKVDLVNAAAAPPIAAVVYTT